MNIEFILHGVLSSGQSVTDQNDINYYKPFYCEQKESILMTVEVVDRPHGVSTYYNYLRYNNVISSRTGSYFGMTVRIDGSYCLDVKNMYLILDNLFTKMIVGKILRESENNYEYIVDSFSSEKAKIEQQFSNMFGSFFSPSDFKDVSKKNVSEQKKLTINPYDLTPSVTNEVFVNRGKLYLSTSYPSKQTQSVQTLINQVKAEANNKVKEAEEQLTTFKRHQESNSEFSSAKIAKLEKEKKNLEDERNQLINENNELTQKLNKFSKDKDIINTVKDIKSPITELAALFAARFQEDNSVDSKSSKRFFEEKQQNYKEKVWLSMVNCILGVAILLVLLFCLFGPSESFKSDNLEKKQTEIKNPKGAMASEPDDDISENVCLSAVAIDTIDYKKKDIRINIEPLTKQETELTLDTVYTFEIAGKYANSIPNGGKWMIFEDNKIHRTNSIRTSQAGANVKVIYYINDVVVRERDIKIKKK